MKHKKAIVIIILVTLSLIAYIAHKNRGNVIVVECSHPTVETIEKTIPVNGKIQPTKSISISPEVSGEIVDINYNEGDEVNYGDIIIRIKPDLYESLVERAEASLGSAISRMDLQSIELNHSKENHERSLILFTQGNISLEEKEISENEYNISLAQLNSCQYDVKTAEAALREAKENYLKTYIKAPMSGIISRMNVKIGERVVGTSQMAGTELFQIVGMNRMELIVNLNENDIPKVKINDSVKITVDAFPDRNYYGFINKIANSSKNIGANIEQVSTFEVRILIDSHSFISGINEEMLLPGMSASGSIIVDKKSDIKTIPTNAIFTKDNKEYIWIVNKEKIAELREITSGIRNLQRVEIISGLSDEDLVVIGPYSAINRISEGEKIKIEDE